MAIELATPQTETLLSGDELLELGNIGPCELIEGRIVPMSPTGFSHGHFENNFANQLTASVIPNRLGKVVVGEVGIYTQRNPDTVRAADVAFISNERFAKQKRPSGFLEVAPELVVEILSPDDRWQEVNQKLREYFAVGVKLVWVADPAAKTVYAYRSLTNLRIFAEADTLTADDDVLPGFSVPVASLFEE